MILNIDTPAVSAEVAASCVAAPSGSLFRMGEASEGVGVGSRWGRALVLAVVVHAGGLAAGLAFAARPVERAVEPEPELVLLAFKPPPPASGGQTQQAAKERASRPARARVSRPVVAPRAVVPQPLPEPEVVEPAKPEEPPATAPDESLPESDSGAESGPGPVVAGGVAGGVEGGVQGGIVGASGGAGDAVGLAQVLRAPAVLKQPRPEYPRRARSDGIQGLVLVRIIVGTQGEVETEHTRVIRSIPALDAAAISAVNRWRFTPAIGRLGRPVRVILELPVQFSLK
ncbi:energy transducer TonB [Myxococcus fulvus]|uniref:energy transducer TonB n=1 Tax=Myxococcus fulvus TaxID=33 RepID=UPI003B9D5A39